MTTNRPYLIRAMYDWINDNDLTPHMVVDASVPGANIPSEYTQDGRIVLNVASRAVSQLEMGNDWIFVSARFSGQAVDLSFPPAAVLAIYAKENGEGMAFPESNMVDDSPPPEPSKPGKAKLSIVK